MAFPNATSTGSSACFGDGVGTDESSRTEYDHTTDDLPHKMHCMFLTNSRFELSISPFLQERGVTDRRFVLVEQCLFVPLWHIQVVPRVPLDSDEIQCSTLYLVTQVEDVLKMLSLDWESSKVHVLLPGYMAKSDSLTLGKCLGIWECRTAGDDTRPRWLFETDLGSFADPSQDDGVDPKDLKKFALRWQAA